MFQRFGSVFLSTAVFIPACLAIQTSIPALSPSFGHSIAMARSTLVAGDPNATDGHGKLWIYTRPSQGDWKLFSILEGAKGDSLGYSLDADGHLLIAGAPGNRKAYLYDLRTRQPSPPLYEIAQDVDGYGRSVAIQGIYAAVGSPDSQMGRGQADIYIQSAQNEWLWRQSLYGESPNEAFGHSLALDSEILIVGAPEAYEPRGERAGLAYIYQRTSGSDWVLQAELRGGSAGYEHRFGFRVALDHNKGRRLALVGAPGASTAYIYTLERDSWEQMYAFTPVPPVEMTRTGSSVALWEEYALIGAPSNSPAQSGYTWRLHLDEFGTGGDRSSVQGGPAFGHAVASWGNHYAISEPGTAIHIFSKNAPMTVQKPEFANMQIGAYPNPFQDFITLTLPKNAPDQLSIIDASGRLVSTLSRNGQEQMRWTPHVPTSGVYIILSGLTAKTIVQLP